MEIRQAFAEFEIDTYGREWSVLDLAVGLVVDTGDLARWRTSRQDCGARKGPPLSPPRRDARSALQSQLLRPDELHLGG